MKIKDIFYQCYMLGINMRPDSLLTFDDWWATHENDIYKCFLEKLNQADFLVFPKNRHMFLVAELRKQIEELQTIINNEKK